jgi:hypothetical protein
MVDNGNIHLEGGVAYYVEGGAYRSHFATCPHASHHRKREQKPAEVDELTYVPPRPVTDEEIAALPILDLDEFTRADVVATLGHTPSEGEPVPPAEFVELRRRYDACSDDARAWFKHIREEASSASLDFVAHTVKTTRRYYLYLGLIRLGERGLECDEIARACVAYVRGDDVPLSPLITAGRAVGALDDISAFLFADTVAAYADGELVPLVGDDELLRLHAA